MRNFFSFTKKRENSSSSRSSPSQKQHGNDGSSSTNTSMQGGRNLIELNKTSSHPPPNRGLLPPLPPGAITKQDSNHSNSGAGAQLNSSFQQGSSSSVGGGVADSNQQANNESPQGHNVDSFNKMIQNLIPNKAQKVVDNMMVRYEKFKDIIEKQIKPNRFRLSDEEVQKLTISLTEFDEYKRRIDREFREYQHRKQQNGSFEDHLHDIHLNKNLSACYSRVPSLYFLDNSIIKRTPSSQPSSSGEQIVDANAEEDFPFLLELNRNMKSLQNHQEQLVEYLDEVELNLFYQVYFRFNQILEMILDFNKMGVKCEENLTQVRTVRQLNAKMKRNLCTGAIEISQKKKSIDRMQRTYEILTKLASFSTNQNTQLHEDPQLAVLFEAPASTDTSSTEQHVKASLARIEAYKFLKKKYAKANQIRQQDVYADFLDQASAYLRETLSFREQQRRSIAVEQSIDISSIHSYNSNLHNDSSMHFDGGEEEIDESLQVFDWIFADIPVLPASESHLVGLYLKASNNFDMMRFEVFKNNVAKDIAKFLKYLLQAFQDYCVCLYRANSPQNVPSTSNGEDQFQFLNEINDILLMKFCLFFSNIARVFLTRYFSFFHVMKSSIIKHAYHEDLSVSAWQTNVLPIIMAISKLQMEALETFAQELLAYLHYTNTETEANLAVKITTSNELFTFWIDSFPAVFERTTKLDFEGTPKLPQMIKDELNKVNRDITQTFDISYFFMQKSHLHIELFNTFDARQHQLLETSLTKDTWTPTNISYKIYSTLDYFFIRRQAEDNLINDNDDEEVENFNKVKNRIIAGDSEDEEEDLQDMSEYYLKKPEREYKIQLNKLIFEKENRKYMMTEGFLVFIRQVQRYIGLMWESQIAHTSQQVSKLIALIRSYNSLARELIVKGKAARFAQMANRINVKNLATSSLNLAFLMKILPKIVDRLPSNIIAQNPQISDQFDSLALDVENHIEELFLTITNILKEMVNKSAQAIQQLGWNKAQEKINVPLAQTAKIIDSMRTMHNVLEEILNPAELIQVFDIIISNFTQSYMKTFEVVSTLPESNRLSEQRLKDEVTYIANEIIEINVVSSLSSTLDLIHAIEVIVPLETLPKIEKLKARLISGDQGDDLNRNALTNTSHSSLNDSNSENNPSKNNKVVKDNELERIAKKFATNSTTAEEGQSNQG